MSLVWPILAHLSAEPLVGLKLRGVQLRRGVPHLSAEPLVGLKQGLNPWIFPTSLLSAEPLVGLKLEDGPQRGVRGGLSAEPLVGLKRTVHLRRRYLLPFSRTPRGFEASNTTQPK